jgi:hypothetical protein
MALVDGEGKFCGALSDSDLRVRRYFLPAACHMVALVIDHACVVGASSSHAGFGI